MKRHFKPLVLTALAFLLTACEIPQGVDEAWQEKLFVRLDIEFWRTVLLPVIPCLVIIAGATAIWAVTKFVSTLRYAPVVWRIGILLGIAPPAIARRPIRIDRHCGHIDTQAGELGGWLVERRIDLFHRSAVLQSPRRVGYHALRRVEPGESV